MSAIDVDPNDPTPVYEQIRRQLVTLITNGVLGPGTRLAPVRQLAADLELANGTVARAYRELEAAGFLRTRRGGGTTVLKQAPEATAAARRARLDNAAKAFASECHALGITSDEAFTALREALTTARTADPPSDDEESSTSQDCCTS